MSAIVKFVQKMNFTAMQTPAIMRIGQDAARLIGPPEMAAGARWGIAGGILVYWMIEPNFEGKTE